MSYEERAEHFLQYIQCLCARINQNSAKVSGLIFKFLLHEKKLASQMSRGPTAHDGTQRMQT